MRRLGSRATTVGVSRYRSAAEDSPSGKIVTETRHDFQCSQCTERFSITEKYHEDLQGGAAVQIPLEPDKPLRGRVPYVDSNLSADDVADILILIALLPGEKLPLLALWQVENSPGQIIAKMGFFSNPKFGGGVLLQLCKDDGKWRIRMHSNWTAQ